MADKTINAQQELAEIEREELRLLIQQGVKFDVKRKELRRLPGLKGFFRKPEIREVTETFELKEPTLSTLDRLSAVWLEIDINEDGLTGGTLATIQEAKYIAHRNVKKAALIVAIAALGEDYYINEVDSRGRIKQREDKAELQRLTTLFFHSVKPSQLVELANTVTTVSNLPDFIGSMRLMKGARQTKPGTDRIE